MSKRKFFADGTHINKLEKNVQQLELFESNNVAPVGSKMGSEMGSSKGVEIEPNRNYEPKEKPKRIFAEILKDGFVTFRKPYGKLEKVAFDDPRAKSYLETLCPSEKGDDNAKV